MKYKMIELTEEFIIHKIVSIHYFEYMSNFTFAGESHNFWELLCVDKGEVNVTANQELLNIQRGQVIFHKPNEFHNVTANGIIAPNLVVIGFECQSPAMHFFENQILPVCTDEQNLLATLIAESRQCFLGRLDDPYQEELVRNPHIPFGCEQMIKLCLEQFLISMYRKAKLTRKKTSKPILRDHTPIEVLYASVIEYFNQNIQNQLTIRQISQDNLISPSQLKKIFLETEGCGVMEAFHNLKLEKAKQLIREHQMNFTQISEYLGYSSIHYFSRQFKQLTGMTPTEYITSIKKLSETPYHNTPDHQQQ